MSDTDVLIVGAGPVGLMMACQLKRYGVAFRIVDKATGRSTRSKALAVWSRTLEALHDFGLDQAVIEAGHKVHGASIFAEGRRVVHLTFDEIPSPYSFALMLPQSETERLLEDHLKSLGACLEREVELVDMEQDETGVTCRLVGPDGEREELRVAWLIGCDGAHSTVRHRLGVDFPGKAEPDEFVLGDVTVEGQTLDDEVSVYWHREGVLAFFPVGGTEYRVIADIRLKDPDQPSPPPNLEQLQAIVDERASARFQLSEPRWLSSFRIHERKVKSYREGRVFLAGDAAHIHSPVGGQGMNTGMQDAYDLGWKLGLVLGHKAPEGPLLDSYSRERGAVGEFVIRNAGLATQVAMMRHPVAQYLRNRMAAFLSSLDVVQERMRASMAEIDLKYRKSSLSKEHIGIEAANWTLGVGVRPGERAPDGRLLELPEDRECTLFELLRGRGYRLLLFQGAARTSGRFDDLLELGKRVGDRFGDYLRIFLILREAHHKPTGIAYFDPDLRVHKTYGASTTCLYLIRPDGYVGFRSLPPSEKHLVRYLEQFLPGVGVTAFSE